MKITFFSGPLELIAGLIVGIIFGFLLNKANVTKFSTIIRQLLLKDFTVMKVIMTAIGCGSLILYFVDSFFYKVHFVISSTTIFSAFIGGGVFGIGMAVLGYCPGTCVGALSLKAKEPWLGLLGMIVGGAIYAEVFPWIKKTIKPDYEISKILLSEYFGISPWFFIFLIGMCIAGFVFLDKKFKVKHLKNANN